MIDLSAILSVGSAIKKFFRRPELVFMPFDVSNHLQTWDLRSSSPRFQKVFTIEVRNIGKNSARGCVGFIDIKKVGDSRTHGDWFALHWADIDYSFKTTGADSVDIGPAGHRLDVVFTFQNQARVDAG